MAAPDRTKIYRLPGTLYHTPTDLSDPASGLGTAMGTADLVVLRRVQRTSMIVAEEYGHDGVDGEMVEGVYLGESWVLGARLRGIDNDAFGIVFPNVVTGGIKSPGTTLAGALLTARAKIILWCARDYANVPSVILYRALPLVEETAELKFGLKTPLYVPVLFHGVRNASGVVGYVDLLADLPSV